MTTTDAIAVTAVTSWAWLPPLSEVSALAALALPILGVVWLVVRIVLAVWRYRSG